MSPPPQRYSLVWHQGARVREGALRQPVRPENRKTGVGTLCTAVSCDNWMGPRAQAGEAQAGDCVCECWLWFSDIKAARRGWRIVSAGGLSLRFARPRDRTGEAIRQTEPGVRRRGQLEARVIGWSAPPQTDPRITSVGGLFFGLTASISQSESHVERGDSSQGASEYLCTSC